MHSIHSNVPTLYCPLLNKVYLRQLQKYHTLLDNILCRFMDIPEHIFNCYMVAVSLSAVKNYNDVMMGLFAIMIIDL